MAGVEQDRVAEILVETENGGRRGSGYRLSTDYVITAAHVVADSLSVRVRFNADLAEEWITSATVTFANSAADAAILSIAPRSPGEHVPRALFGRVGERAAVVKCVAVGFPRFKLRDDTLSHAGGGESTRYRDSYQADGTISSLSNWREGALEIVVPPPERDPGPARSPWEGMSGAAVWSADRIIGLVIEHHRADGLNRLAAVRIERWYQQLLADQLSRLREMTGLPEYGYVLVDVIPLPAADAVTADYTAQIEAIAPTELHDRDTELAELVSFCAGLEPYQWWQGDPWAGKTALSSWFSLHPPVGVSTVSFFITGRLAGQSDSVAFTEAVIQQLAVVAGESFTLAATPAARDGQRRRLLTLAAVRAAERNERLVLIVDGLDEDRGTPPNGPVSIAALLPENSPDNLRVLITSRPHPGLPADVRATHPLRSCKVRMLTRSAYAENLEMEATLELTEQMRGDDRLQIDIIGYITAADGGLSLGELVELTAARGPEVSARLGSVFGRSLYARPAPEMSHESAEQVYLFAHETLQEIAERLLVYDIGEYRQRLLQWADEYRDDGWPAGTPRYLFRPYARLLAAVGEHARLAAIAIDTSRHDRMLDRTLGDGQALSEIADAQQLCLAEPSPDLTSLVLLAIERDRLTHRNIALPRGLPALWVRLGQPGRGQALAVSLSDPGRQAEALADLSKALALNGQRGQAERTAQTAVQSALTVSDPGRKADALAAVGIAVALFGDPGQAERIAHSIDIPERRSEALADLVAALASVGQLSKAERVARSIADPRRRVEALSSLVCALSAAGLIEQAASLARDAESAASGLTDQGLVSEALRSLTVAFAAAGLTEEAARLALAAENAAREMVNPALRAWRLAALASTLAKVDRLNQSERVAQAAEEAAYGQMGKRTPTPAGHGGCPTRVCQSG